MGGSKYTIHGITSQLEATKSSMLELMNQGMARSDPEAFFNFLSRYVSSNNGRMASRPSAEAGPFLHAFPGSPEHGA
jgi:hypothetical protein